MMQKRIFIASIVVGIFINMPKNGGSGQQTITSILKREYL